MTTALHAVLVKVNAPWRLSLRAKSIQSIPTSAPSAAHAQASAPLRQSAWVNRLTFYFINQLWEAPSGCLLFCAMCPGSSSATCPRQRFWRLPGSLLLTDGDEFWPEFTRFWPKSVRFRPKFAATADWRPVIKICFTTCLAHIWPTVLGRTENICYFCGVFPR